MGLKVKAISELDAATVQQAQEEFTQLLQERYPELDLRRGVIHDVIAFLSGGVSGAVNQTEINRVLNSRSLLAMQTDPELADPVLIDHVLSNVGISRKVGTRASGEITIVVTGGETAIIPANAKYTAAGVEFRVDTAIVARPAGTTISETTERILTDRGDGSYSFTVPATAVDVGAEANVRPNTTFLPDPVPARFVTAFASGDFTGGTSTESNAQLLTRMSEAVPAAAAGGRANLTSLIKAQPVFGDTLHYNYAGFGDPEMQRDQRSIFPVSMGGCIDVYARTSAYPITVAATVTCTLVNKTGAYSTWIFSVPRTLAAGFYEVSRIRAINDTADTSGFKILTDSRGWDLTGTGWRPDIKSAQEAAYTPWQTAMITFEDNLTPTADLTVYSQKEYAVEFLTMPLLTELQDFISDESVRPLAADVLVRAATPCLVSVNATLLRTADESAPDLAPIRVAIVNQINNLNFPGTLYSSQLIDTIHSFLSGNTVVGSIVMQGRILRPDGEVVVIRDQIALQIPNAPSVLVTPTTTAFYIDISDVGLTVKVR